MNEQTKMSKQERNGNFTHRLKAVYNIQEKSYLDKPIWLRVGTAWVNRDNSINVTLDEFPQNGKLHIRDLPAPKQDN